MMELRIDSAKVRQLVARYIATKVHGSTPAEFDVELSDAGATVTRHRVPTLVEVVTSPHRSTLDKAFEPLVDPLGDIFERSVMRSAAGYDAAGVHSIMRPPVRTRAGDRVAPVYTVTRAKVSK